MGEHLRRQAVKDENKIQKTSDYSASGCKNCEIIGYWYLFTYAMYDKQSYFWNLNIFLNIVN